MIKLIHGECIEEMDRLIEQGVTVDAIITDPPYGTMKGARLDGWGGLKTDWDETINNEAMLDKCNKLLRTNGSLILFSQQPYTTKLINDAHGNLPFSYCMTWLKDHFANPLIAKKSPVNYTEDICVFFKRHANKNANPLALLVKIEQDKAGIYWNDGLDDIYVKMGWSKSKSNAKAVLKHSLNWEYVQFSAPSILQHERIAKFLDIPPFDEMQRIDSEFKKQTPKVFNLPEGKGYKSNVLEHKKDYTGLHPTQKPVALIEDLIKTYTNEGETVLDFTFGSGTTGVACQNTGRNFIGIEMDDNYFKIAQERISENE